MAHVLKTFIIKLTIVVDRETYEPHLPDHLAYLQDLKQQGVLVLSGPFTDRTGGLVVVQVPTRSDAEWIAMNDPLVKSGVDIYELREWTITDGLRMWTNETEPAAPPTRRLERVTRRLDASTQHLSTLSYEQFLEWADSDILIEWVDGEVVIANPESTRQQVTREFLHNVLRIFVSVNKLGLMRVRCKMKLVRSGREPGLIFVSTDHLDRLKSTYLDGPADVVIEFSSPDTIGQDRGDKFYEYEQASIPEYWLIDPIRRWAEIYALNTQGRYVIQGFGAHGIFHSQVIRGFWCYIEWLWEPPPILQTLRDLSIISD